VFRAVEPLAGVRCRAHRLEGDLAQREGIRDRAAQASDQGRCRAPASLVINAPDADAARPR
jgi:hypothetical protein